MDYKNIAKTISDPENQPHQWEQDDLTQFFIKAVDEIERLREILRMIATAEDSLAEWATYISLARAALKGDEAE
jgi:hypothetical protein